MFPAAIDKEERLIFLDGWRGVAILSVIVGHFVYAQPINLGRVGVELFFVLSGRLMAEILFVRDTRLSRFFPRRISRVYPAMFVFVVLASFASQFATKFAVTWQQFASSLTFTYNYYAVYGESSAFLDHMWSLCVEEHCYILLGALAFVHRRFRLPVVAIGGSLACLAMLNGVLQTSWGLDYYDVYWRTDVRGASIFAAVAACLFFQRPGPRSVLERAPLLVPTLAIVGLALNLNAVPDPIKYTLGTTCFAICVAGLDLAYMPVRDILSTKAFVAVGLVSYSLYLWQQPFYKMAWDFPSRMMLLPCAILAAFLSYRFVEKPARKFINDRWDDYLVRKGQAVVSAG